MRSAVHATSRGSRGSSDASEVHRTRTRCCPRGTPDADETFHATDRRAASCLSLLIVSGLWGAAVHSFPPAGRYSISTTTEASFSAPSSARESTRATRSTSRRTAPGELSRWTQPGGSPLSASVSSPAPGAESTFPGSGSPPTGLTGPPGASVTSPDDNGGFVNISPYSDIGVSPIFGSVTEIRPSPQSNTDSRCWSAPI